MPVSRGAVLQNAKHHVLPIPEFPGRVMGRFGVGRCINTYSCASMLRLHVAIDPATGDLAFSRDPLGLDWDSIFFFFF
jgi:hypothetical protein